MSIHSPSALVAVILLLASLSAQALPLVDHAGGPPPTKPNALTRVSVMPTAGVFRADHGTAGLGVRLGIERAFQPDFSYDVSARLGLSGDVGDLLFSSSADPGAFGGLRLGLQKTLLDGNVVVGGGLGVGLAGRDAGPAVDASLMWAPQLGHLRPYLAGNVAVGTGPQQLRTWAGASAGFTFDLSDSLALAADASYLGSVDGASTALAALGVRFSR